MSRRQKPSSAPWIALVIILAAALTAVAAILLRVYPEYQRLRASDSPPAAQSDIDSDSLPTPLVARLYFARTVEGKQRMVAISRELPPGLGPARASLEELIRGEVPRGCDRPLPPGAAVRSIRVDKGIATVDFTQELISNFRGGSDNEGVTVYAIVNTLTSLPTVDKVKILVDGKSVTSLGGHLDLAAPLAFDHELVVSYP